MSARHACLISIAVAALQASAVHATPSKTLEECIAVAVEHHPSLKAAAASVEAAQQRVYQAASPYLPQVFGAYAANRRSTSAAARTGTTLGTTTQTFNFFNTGVSMSQILFDFGQTLDNIQAAQAAADSIDANRVVQRETVIFNVKQAYFGLLAAQRLVGVASEAVQQSRQHLRLAESRHEVGLAPRFDVTREQVQLASNQLNLLRAKNAAAVGAETLRNTMGLDGPLDFNVLDVDTVEIVDVDEAAAVARANGARPELRSLQAQQRSVEEQVTALRKDYLPNVTGNGFYEWSGTDYPLQDNWNVGASVNLSLFNGGLTTAQVGEAKAILSNLQFNEAVTRQNIGLEVRQAILDMRQSGESITVTATGLRQARENIELAEGRYQTGVGNIIEVTDAQAALTSAEAQHVQASYNYRTALAALERAVAGAVTPGDQITIRSSVKP